MRALVIDDDLALADVLSFTLRRAGYEVSVAHDGRAALERWLADQPDLIILDLNLPKIGGLQVCREIRKDSKVPIIILSVRSDEDDIVEGLKLGADDYIVKPFSPRQLIARAEAVLRRAGTLAAAASASTLTVGDLTLELGRCQARRGAVDLGRLTNLECRLMEVLMLNQGQLLTAEVLIDHVWGAGGGDRTMLKQLIYRLRKKIEKGEPFGVVLETVPGIGYLLKVDR